MMPAGNPSPGQPRRGWLPGTLSELGRQQAVQLGSRYRGGVDLAAVLTSDLHRAIHTAQLAFPDGSPPLRQDPRLRDPFPGGRSYRQMLNATRALRNDLVEKWDGADATLLLITRSANRWALQSLLGRADLAALLLNP